MKRILYLFQEALTSIGTNRTITVIGVITTAFTLVCFGVFLLLYLNIRNVAGSLQDDVQVMVYLEDTVSSQQVSALRRHLQREQAVASLSFISREQALADFHRQFPAESSLLDGIGENPLPSSFVATMTPEHRSSDRVANFAEQVMGLSGVERVRYSRDWIEALTLFVSYLEWGAVIVGLILSVASMTIIANTVRLAFYARKEEIEILRLIGATGTFIAVPFVLEGAVLGALGGGLSLGLLRGGFEFLRLEVNGFTWLQGFESVVEFFPVHMSVLLVLAGLVLGCVGSFLSVYGLLRVRV